MHRIARLLCIALALALFAAQAQAAPQDRRVALVIGNGAYKDAPLRNPTNDARDMAAELKKLGFEVILRENATLRQMEDALNEFWQQLKKGGTGLFYFAGHGLQVNGHNYLVPVDARLEVEQDAKFKCLDAGLVLGRMENAGNGLNIVILDACRNNPFARSWRSADVGLARMDAPKGSIIAYATAPDSVAADGEAKNGLYTEKLLTAMRAPGQPVEQVFKRVRDEVMRATKDRQVPWESTSLRGDFYFAGNSGGAQPMASLAPPAAAPAFPPPRPQQQAAGTLAGTYRWVVNDGAQEYGQFVFAATGNALSGYALGFMLTSPSKRTQLENVRLEGAQLTFQVQHAGLFQFTPSVYSFRCDLANGVEIIPVVELNTPPLKKPIVSSRLVRSGGVANVHSQDAPPSAPGGQPASAGRPQSPPAGLAGPAPGDTWTDPSTGMAFIWVPGGSFDMGCGPWTSDCYADEMPAHPVKVGGFWLGKYEVTQGQWREVMPENPAHFTKGVNHPVEQVSWDDAKAFITRLNGLGSAQFRLPTEAEWEYAARSGGKAEKFSGGGAEGKGAWFKANSGGATQEVGLKAPNGFGLYDMSGNVWEWCEDAYSSFAGPARKNAALDQEANRVLRGGGWNSSPKDIRTTRRSDFSPDYQRNDLGLRLVRVP